MPCDNDVLSLCLKNKFDNIKYNLYNLNMKTVKKSFEILRFLAKEPERSYPLREISEVMGINISTCNLLLKSLVEIGAVEQPSPRKGYSLGPLLYHLTRNGPYKKDISIAAEPFLHDFAEKTGETVIFSALHHNQKKRVILSFVEGNQAVKIRTDIVFLEDVYETASGRLLLAFLPPGELSAVLSKHGYPSPVVWKGAGTKASLEKTLQGIRRKGMIILENRKSSFVQIAFPVTEEGRVIAVVASPVPQYRFTESGNSMIDELKKTAEKISGVISKQKRGA